MSSAGAGRVSLAFGSSLAARRGVLTRLGDTCVRVQCLTPRMARDLIGPALPPGFKAGGSAEDEERDSSPGKRRRLTRPPGPPSSFGPNFNVSSAKPFQTVTPPLYLWGFVFVCLFVFPT